MMNQQVKQSSEQPQPHQLQQMPMQLSQQQQMQQEQKMHESQFYPQQQMQPQQQEQQPQMHHPQLPQQLQSQQIQQQQMQQMQQQQQEQQQQQALTTVTPTKKIVVRARTPHTVVSNSRSATALLQRALGVEPSRHIMNTSKSKQMFSFGIGARFKPMSVMNHQVGYNMKSTLSEKGPTFGIGPKTPHLINKDSKNFPEPGAYKLPSDFEKNLDASMSKGGKMYTFGAGREAYDRVYYKERIPHDRSVPGPGHYEQHAQTMKTNRNKSFTILGRIPRESHIAVKVHNPGPGAYEEKNDLSADGRYVQTKNRTSCVPQFKLPTNKKLNDQRVVAQSIGVDVPGPGSYTPCEGSVSNRYRNTYDYKLHKYDRKIELYDKTKLNLPGPQHYILPSDFGNSHLKSQKTFNIPTQQQATIANNLLKKNRTRNNAAIIPRTKSNNQFAYTMAGSISQQDIGDQHRLKQSFTQIQTPKLTEPQNGETESVDHQNQQMQQPPQQPLNSSENKSAAAVRRRLEAAYKATTTTTKSQSSQYKGVSGSVQNHKIKRITRRPATGQAKTTLTTSSTAANKGGVGGVGGGQSTTQASTSAVAAAEIQRQDLQRQLAELKQKNLGTTRSSIMLQQLKSSAVQQQQQQNQQKLQQME